jgi:hypothetical protein
MPTLAILFFRELPKVFRSFSAVLAVRAMDEQCATIGISQPSQRDMPMRYCRLEAKSKQNPPDLENRFLH